jgi:hypothetical protein
MRSASSSQRRVISSWFDGDIAARDCLLRYERDGHPLAVASIHREVESLKAELAIEGAG